VNWLASVNFTVVCGVWWRLLLELLQGLLMVWGFTVLCTA
jgi:hypothetical protein